MTKESWIFLRLGILRHRNQRVNGTSLYPPPTLILIPDLSLPWHTRTFWGLGLPGRRPWRKRAESSCWVSCGTGTRGSTAHPCIPSNPDPNPRPFPTLPTRTFWGLDLPGRRPWRRRAESSCGWGSCGTGTRGSRSRCRLWRRWERSCC